MLDRKKAHNFYAKNSKVYRAFTEMEKKTYTDDHLEKRYKELIAVGISVVINCESCMEWHINEALKSGATRDQVLEAVEVGFEMGGGPATVSGRFAYKVLEYYTAEDKKA
ncbi:MAG: carboxymuconolactone decarboxylase family protein [Candidatus Zixiibacteriota bacterium]